MECIICFCSRFVTFIFGKNKNRVNPRRGLTLIELAIVILVLGVIMAIVYGNLSPTDTLRGAKKLQIQSASTLLETNLTRYEIDNGALEDGARLTILSQTTDSWRGIKNDQVMDPWKNPYFVCFDNASNRQICTYGADGTPGGKGESEDFYITDQSSWPSWLKSTKKK